MSLYNIISTKQFLDKDLLKEVFSHAREMEEGEREGKRKNSLEGKILATLFYEPSTRTRFSFEAAIHRLGGEVITTESASHFSSVAKGEMLRDTIKVVSSYVDGIVLRHHEEGSAQRATQFSSVPIINGGDGTGEHPTQALLDLYTIKKELGEVKGMNIALIGDLLYGRTIHSLIYLLSLYNKGIKLYLVSPPQLRLPRKYKQHLKKHEVEFEEVVKLEKIIRDVDMLYVTRIQKERFPSQKEYNKLKGSYTIDKQTLDRLSSESIIMHPLPRISEISFEVDKDPRASYFRQAENGLYIRMALLDLIYNA